MIELLIVVAVMVILIGIALPVMKTGIEGRKLREASRQVNTAVTLAKSLAAETDRFAGLVIDVESVPESPKVFATRLYLAETPPPYAGDMVGATATITGLLQATFDASSANLVNVAKIRDLVRFDHRNPYYEITGIVSAGPNFLVSFSATSSASWPSTGLSLPYEIIRLPEKSSATPLELPKGAVIDLTNSGFGLSNASLATAIPSSPPAWVAENPYVRGTYCRPTNRHGFCYIAVVGGISSATVEPTWPTSFGGTVVDGTVTWQRVSPASITVVFAPTGRMTRVIGLNPPPFPPPFTDSPTQTLHLLVGNLENIGALNLADRSSLWVSVGHHTGRITTAENSSFPPIWTDATAYTSGTYCQPTTPNGLCYIVTVPGMSGGTEPSWPIPTPGVPSPTVADGGVVWECRSPPAWSSASVFCPAGSYCRPTTPNGYCYVATVAGTSGGSEPTWPTELGATVTDGTPPNEVTWECTLNLEPVREYAQSAQAMGGR